MKTRPFLPFVILLILSLLASACSQGTPAVGADNQSQANAALSPATKLAVGTLKLEGSQQAVTAEQASSLLTLWQAYQALSNSDTTAEVELDAVVKQIQEAMTADQIQAIDSMSLTRQSMMEVLQSLGMGPGSSSGTGAQSTPPAVQSFASGSGNMPPGGTTGGGPGGAPPAGGFVISGGPGDGSDMPPDAVMGTNGNSAQATPNATAQARIAIQATRVSPMVLQALIQVLQDKGK